MAFPPAWWLVLEAAQGDPLRAQEIEEQVSEEWWLRFKANREAHKKAMKALEEGQKPNG